VFTVVLPIKQAAHAHAAETEMPEQEMLAEAV
jgi:hypothetical protein